MQLAKVHTLLESSFDL